MACNFISYFLSGYWLWKLMNMFYSWLCNYFSQYHCIMIGQQENNRALCAVLCLATQSIDSLQPHGLEPARLLCPWDSLGNNTGVGCHALLQGIFPNPGVDPRSLHCRRILTLRATREACTTKTRISERILQSVFKMQMPIRVILKFFENHKCSGIAFFLQRSGCVSTEQPV